MLEKNNIISKLIIRGWLIFLLVSFLSISCKSKIDTIAQEVIIEKPNQVIRNMQILQSDSGVLRMRIEAPIMERFQKHTHKYDYFPNGMLVFGFTKDGLVESEIKASKVYRRYISDKDIWEAFGKVVVKNFINGQRLETDTLYWDTSNRRIYTNCFVKLSSPNFYMQGYGLESDDMGKNATIRKPFDSEFNTDSASTVYIDSTNFVGPIIKKVKK